MDRLEVLPIEAYKTNAGHVDSQYGKRGEQAPNKVLGRPFMFDELANRNPSQESKRHVVKGRAQRKDLEVSGPVGEFDQIADPLCSDEVGHEQRISPKEGLGERVQH